MSGRKVQQFDIGEANGFEDGKLFALDPDLEEGYYLLKVSSEKGTRARAFIISR